MGWAAQQFQVTATTPKSVVTFGQNGQNGQNGPNAPADGRQTIIGAVSLTLVPLVVNGFTATSGRSPYCRRNAQCSQNPAHSARAHIEPGLCSTSACCQPGPSGSGLQIVWNIAPTDAFIHAATAGRSRGRDRCEVPYEPLEVH